MPRLRVLAAALAATAAVAQPNGHANTETYSTGVGTDYPKQVFFGDLHLHSNISADAQSMGNLLLTSADAYRFARGEQVMASNGLPARLKRPLDFLAVTDHAEFMGIYRMFNLQDPRLMATSLGQAWREKYGEGITQETMEQGPIEDGNANPILEFVMSINEPNPERDGYPAELKNAIRCCRCLRPSTLVKHRRRRWRQILHP